MNLNELFNQVLDDLEPMPDQVPRVQRIARRQYGLRMAALGAACAAVVFGVGLVVAAPWSDRGDQVPGGGPGSFVRPSGFGSTPTPAPETAAQKAFAQVVSAAVPPLWPVAHGLTATGVDVHFGTDGFTMATGADDKPPFELVMDFGEVNQANLATYQACPSEPPGATVPPVTPFCTEAILPHGLIVQISNLTAAGYFGQAVSPSVGTVSPFSNWFVLGAPETVPLAGGAVVNYGMIEEVTLWKGTLEETLYVPELISDGKPYPSVDQLQTIAESGAFQQLLTEASNRGVIPSGTDQYPAEAPTVGYLVPTQDSYMDNATIPAMIYPTGTGPAIPPSGSAGTPTG